MKCQMPQISWHGRDPVLSVDFQVIQDGGEIRRLASGGTDGHVVIWYVNICPKNVVTVECACDLNRHNKSVNVVRFSPSGELLASGDDEGAIITWKLREKTSVPSLDLEDGSTNKEDWAPFKVLRGHIDDICDISWSPNSEFLVSGSIDNSIIIWDVLKGQNIRMSKDCKGFVQGVAWDPLNQFMATLSSDRFLRIYSVASRKVVYKAHRAPWMETDENGVPRPSKLFHDDTLKSFCRRLTFTPDGNLLFAPSGVREKGEKQIHSTYAFPRHDLTHPMLQLPTGSKYTLAVRCCPVLFKLRELKGERTVTSMIELPYRMLVAVATQDSIFLYDTQQLLPFAYVCNIHYTHLTDITWSSDGRLVMVSSTDGYCSFIIFNEGELGEVYVPPVEPVEKIPSVVPEEKMEAANHAQKSPKSQTVENGAADSKESSNTSNEKTPSPRKQKTPKKVPVSQKKTPKMCTIKHFFTPGKERQKTQSPETILGQPGKSSNSTINAPSKLPEMMDCDTAISDDTSTVSESQPDVEMSEELARPLSQNVADGTSGVSNKKPVVVITLDDSNDVGEPTLKKLRSEETVSELTRFVKHTEKNESTKIGQQQNVDEASLPLTTKIDKQLRIDAAFKMKQAQNKKTSLSPTGTNQNDSGKKKSPAKLESVDATPETVEPTAVVSSISASNKNGDPIPERTAEKTNSNIVPSPIQPQSVSNSVDRPKKRIQLVTLSNKVSSIP